MRAAASRAADRVTHPGSPCHRAVGTPTTRTPGRSNARGCTANCTPAAAMASLPSTAAAFVSWLPSMANTGTPAAPSSAATAAHSFGRPCWVRSPFTTRADAPHSSASEMAARAQRVACGSLWSASRMARRGPNSVAPMCRSFMAANRQSSAPGGRTSVVACPAQADPGAATATRTRVPGARPPTTTPPGPPADGTDVPDRPAATCTRPGGADRQHTCTEVSSTANTSARSTGSWYTKTMNAEGVVAGFIGALERGDVDAAMAYVAPDAEYDNVPMSKAIGHEQIRGVLGMFVGPESPLEFKVLRQVASGNLVMNERVDILTVGGKRVELPVAGVWEVDASTSKITL